ncbi:putative metal-dependent hydrolase YcfH [bacterium HR40]|nr:putative metal-dependent hydrolase YcfH [bacterium HR40]
MFVDSHCHLDFPGLRERVEEVVARARAVGVERIVTIATRRSAWEEAIALCERFPEVFCALGVHPHQAASEGLEDVEPLCAACRHPKVVAVGEAGLDYHYDRAPRERQLANFRAHIEAARQTGLPLVVHTRNADEDTAELLEEEMERGHFTGVIHCFSSSRALATRALAIGFFFGIGGILTFRRSDELRRIVAELPTDRLLLETDAPYLAPEPCRGRTNEPALLVHTAGMLARLKGVAVEEVGRITTAAFDRLFWKARVQRCGS